MDKEVYCKDCEFLDTNDDLGKHVCLLNAERNYYGNKESFILCSEENKDKDCEDFRGLYDNNGASKYNLRS